MKKKNEIIEKIKSSIEDITLGDVPSEKIKPEDGLISDCGLDSLDYATVMFQVEEWTGIKIKEDKVRWPEIRTIEQLADLFKEHEKL